VDTHGMTITERKS